MSLQKFIQNIPLDKKEHLVLGVIYSSLIPLGGLFGVYGALIGFAIGTYLVLWKELWYDLHKKKGKAEFLDFVYNEIPLIITLLAYLNG